MDSPGSSPDLSEDDQLQHRKWKVKQVPSAVEDEKHNGSETAGRNFTGGDKIHRVTKSTEVTEELPSPEIPVAKWKVNIPQDDDIPITNSREIRSKVPPGESKESDVPVVKWKKVKMPEESQNSDVPVVRKKAKLPENSQSADVPVVKWKAKVPDDSDVPVVKWKAKMPEESHNPDLPVVRKKAKGPENSQSPDVPVVKWKPKMPNDSSTPVFRKPKLPEDSHSSDVPVIRKKVKMPEESQKSDVPVVRRKAKVPQDSHNSDVPVIRKKAKMPGNSQSPDVPIVKWKAKMPEDSHNSDAPVIRGKESPALEISNPQGLQRSPKGHRRKIAKMPAGDRTSSDEYLHSHSAPNIQPGEESVRASRYSSHQAKLQSVLSSLNSQQLEQQEPSQHDNGESETVPKSGSRRSSFSESRSPSPPSISPQVRIAMGSPILSRRTPSPARSQTGSMSSLNARQSPAGSPALQRKQLQMLSGNQQYHSLPRTSPGGSGGGIPSPSSPNHRSKLRTPRSQSASIVKTNAPMKGLTPPSDRKKRVLPSLVAGRSPIQAHTQAQK